MPSQDKTEYVLPRNPCTAGTICRRSYPPNANARCTINPVPYAHLAVRFVLAGYSLGESDTMTLNPTSEYISGCAGCGEYAAGEKMLYSSIYKSRKHVHHQVHIRGAQKERVRRSSATEADLLSLSFCRILTCFLSTFGRPFRSIVPQAQPWYSLERRHPTYRRLDSPTQVPRYEGKRYTLPGNVHEAHFYGRDEACVLRASFNRRGSRKFRGLMLQ